MMLQRPFTKKSEVECETLAIVCIGTRFPLWHISALKVYPRSGWPSKVHDEDDEQQDGLSSILRAGIISRRKSRVPILRTAVTPRSLPASAGGTIGDFAKLTCGHDDVDKFLISLPAKTYNKQSIWLDKVDAGISVRCVPHFRPCVQRPFTASRRL